MIEYAIYDMDRTITRSGTYSPWLLFWACRRAPWRLALVPVAALFGLAYLAGFVSRGRLKELNHRLLMGRRVSPEKLRPVVDAFAAKLIRSGCYAEALAQIASDRVAGRRVMLATASYEFYVEGIARCLGVNEIVATRSRRDSKGRIMARLDGENCYGDAKLRMVKAYFAEQGVDRADLNVRFYSDHHTDMPVFDWADERIAIHPTPKLRAVAESKGWQIIDWH